MPLRGEVWWVHLNPTQGSEIGKTRPCVVVTSDIVNERRRTVVVIPLSTSPIASPPLLVSVTCDGRRAIAVVDQIRAVSKQRFDRLMGTLSAADLAALEDGITQVLELS
jgi:mRNA interferase MazF